MAQIPYDGVAGTRVSESMPDDYQRIQATPASFGGLIAQGLDKFGQGATQAGHFFGQVAADDASNNLQDFATKLMYGDPNKQVPGPDGSMQPDTGYMGLKGRAALDARPHVEAALDAQMKQIRGGLTTSEQQLQFDTASRRYRAHLAEQIGSTAERQASVWYSQVNDATTNLAVEHIAQNADNPEEFAHGAADIIRAKVKQAQLLGGGPELIAQAELEGKQIALKAQVQSISATNPSRALNILDNNKDIAGTLYEPMRQALVTRADQYEGLGAGERAVGALGPVSSQRVFGAIIGQESGGNPNAGKSVTGATGVGQIQPGTFRQYAKPGESISNPADNARVAQRIINDYYTRYGGDPARVAVAYFSGPGNVAPPGSAVPYIQNRADPTGKTTASYVADVNRRLGRQGGPQSLPPDDQPTQITKADAYKQIQDDPDLSPGAKSHALGYINQHFEGQQAEQRLVNRMIDDDTASIITSGQPLNDLSLERVQKTMGAQAAQEFQVNRTIAQNYFQQTHDWSGLSDDAIRSRVDALAPEPGQPGYGYALKLHDHANAQAQVLLKQRYDDPAGSVSSLPSVQKAAKLAGNNPALFGGVVKARLYAQSQLGIPEGAQSPITDEEAKKYASLLRPVSTSQANVEQQEKAINDVVQDVNARYGQQAQSAMTRVLYHVTMKKDAADVLANAMTKLVHGDRADLVDPQTARQAQINRDTQRAAQIAGSAPTLPTEQMNENNPAAPVTVNTIKTAAQKQQATTLKPFHQAVDLLRSDPVRLMPSFVKKFGPDSVPSDLRQYVPQVKAQNDAGSDQ